jgi:hypothetical protein
VKKVILCFQNLEKRESIFSPLFDFPRLKLVE